MKLEIYYSLMREWYFSGYGKAKEMKEIKENNGLYTPSLEKDSCGVGLLADLNGKPDHNIVDSALTMLENMEHRGACGCEENTGDGAGILTQIPHKFYYNLFSDLSVDLPAKGKYGVGMFFYPKKKSKRKICEAIMLKYIKEFDFKILHTREVPRDNSDLGESALKSEPDVVQYFFKTTGFNFKDLEMRFYLLRNSILKEVYFTYPDLRDDFYICSLSSKTIVYKGLLRAIQLRDYYTDLNDKHFQSAIAIVHSRFSTNTTPKWKLAQPFRCIAHNGEINTIQGNMNWWSARERYMELVDKAYPKFLKVFPICDPFISDSGNFDNVVDFLQHKSRSIPHSIMMMIPEAWQNDDQMPDYKKAFYKYHENLMEPWDGPASICFTDGTILGATLDRNGLRPSRYILTSDNLLILGSEVGALDIDPSTIIKKGRLEPGKMLLADLDEQRIISDDELKETICKRKPYQTWIDQNEIKLVKSKTAVAPDLDKLNLRQSMHGIYQEDVDVLLKSMLTNKKEPIGSMGLDIPLAILSKKDQHLSNYFKQQFAQVTNPPIDPLREDFYMSLASNIGLSSKIIDVDGADAKFIRFESPFIDENVIQSILETEDVGSNVVTVSTCYKKETSIQQSIEAICAQVIAKINKGKQIIVLSDRKANKSQVPIPSLLITGAIHHALINSGLRREATIIVDAGDVWETHHAATLFSFGADLICPYLALATIYKLAKENKVKQADAKAAYMSALKKGLLKIMSKLGVSTLPSYKGAQTFEILGLATEVVDVCFKGTISRIEGLNFETLQLETENRHSQAYLTHADKLENLGIYKWRRKGEYHIFNPQTIHLLQHSTKQNNYELFKKFSKEIDALEVNSSTLRSYLRIKKGKSIPLESVEPIQNILKRFVTGAMSFGSLSYEAHSTLAIAMNRIGGKSNSGEGGEDTKRYTKLPSGDSERSAIKQVASGRFGVDIEYLNNANEIQIKVSQGAKPGEGGQLPGHKVDKNIAKVRNATEGVSLISPPPHHDIYSIEDLAQLIFDLKNANKNARISVKLVSKTGVGVIASGVAKAHADHILISGSDGGTGASPLSSIKHAGIPWEIGLAETHQTLVKNGLRDRVTLQADGQIRTARDMAVATMLGAEEWGVATAALVVEGCIIMRKCHLNTCPVGIATQDKDLRKMFSGKADHLVNYFTMLAVNLREIMASVGIRQVDELVGRTDLLEIKGLKGHWKTKNVNLKPLLFKSVNKANSTAYKSKAQDHGIDEILDHKLIELSQNALKYNKTYNTILKVKNTDRAIGTMLSSVITQKYGGKGLSERTLSFKFKGAAGQSFGAFACKGLYLNIEGDANDYFGKGLSGAILAIKPDSRIENFVPSNNILVGNVALYGGTKGQAFICGQAGDRFAVRNSGVNTVVEGIGDNGCEYMTGGKVVVLGRFGRNFGAGMSGGIVYLYKTKETNLSYINEGSVKRRKCNAKDKAAIRQLLRKHMQFTGSNLALEILNDWDKSQTKFIKVISEEYEQAIKKITNQKLKKTV